MHKVVTERRRWNPGPSKQHRRANLDYDLLPRYEGMKKPYQHRKCLTDLLGPLRRWLYSQVGRPWNDVYSEACQVIRPDGILRIHVKTHLMEFVERGTFLENGRASYYAHFRQSNRLRMPEGYHPRIRFYVHPVTGLLQVRAESCWTQIPSHAVQFAHRPESTRLFVCINGSWFECTMEPMPDHVRDHKGVAVMDRIVKRHIGCHEAYDLYGAYIFCRSRRSLGKREIRSHGLLAGSISPILIKHRSGHAAPQSHVRTGALQILALYLADNYFLCVPTCTKSSPNGRDGTAKSQKVVAVPI